MIPILCVILFFILGLWILADPLPGILLLNFPEIIGRFVIALHYQFVTQAWLVAFAVTLAPTTSTIAYLRLIGEMELMLSTPLGNIPAQEDD